MPEPPSPPWRRGCRTSGGTHGLTRCPHLQGRAHARPTPVRASTMLDATPSGEETRRRPGTRHHPGKGGRRWPSTARRRTRRSSNVCDARATTPPSSSPQRTRSSPPSAGRPCDPDAVLDTIVDSARRLCRAQAAQVYLIDGDQLHARVLGRRDRRAPASPRPRTRSGWTGTRWWDGRPPTTASSRSPTCWPTPRTGAATSRRSPGSAR